MGESEFSIVVRQVQLLSGIILKAARQELTQRLEEAGGDIRAGHYMFLRVLQSREHTLAEVSRRLFLDPSTLVPVADALERKGLIRRVQDPHDRRRTPLALTPAGSELLARIPALSEESAIVQSFKQLGQEKCQQMLSLLAEAAFPLSNDKEVLLGVYQTLQARAAEVAQASEHEEG